MDDEDIYRQLKTVKENFRTLVECNRNSPNSKSARIYNLEECLTRLIDLMLVGIDPEPATEIIHDADSYRARTLPGAIAGSNFDPAPAAGGDDTRGCGIGQDSLPGDSCEDGSSSSGSCDGANGY